MPQIQHLNTIIEINGINGNRDVRAMHIFKLLVKKWYRNIEQNRTKRQETREELYTPKNSSCIQRQTESNGYT